MAGIKVVSKINYPLVILGLAIFTSFILFVDLDEQRPQITYTAAIAILMAFWWVTETIPVGATSLLPLVLFPLLGVLDGKMISNSYINYIIFLYIGGFIMALAIEKWGLHKRIALKILSVIGGSPLKILFGFMLASAFLSMWMSNTATAMMMLPIGFSVIAALKETAPKNTTRSFSNGLLLAIAYACSIGGITTLVGTPPNLSFVRIYEIMFPTGQEISFGNWLLFAFPLAFVLFIITLIYLFLAFKPEKNSSQLPSSFFKKKYADLGKMSSEEKKVGFLFIVLVFLWIFRKSITIGNIAIPGWSGMLSAPEYINDGTVAIGVALLLFIVPSSKKSKALVSWNITKKIPWHIVLLFGGGFAIANGFVESGLSHYLGNLLVGAKDFSETSLIVLVTSLMSGLTEFTSNTATTEMLLPIIGGLATEINVNPLLLMIPVTLAGSMAFMFPIATPPNAIVYGSGKLSMWQMAKTGFVLNLIAIVLITILTVTWGTIVFGL
ncbi:DASS family sodium-coupled anion symporter [Leptobacterium sp. I13]|uniref:SLC13 family permease n=1 Tax=Leptobacterium meishanense TaxID=3128904 RepID=UPI0030ECD663